MSYGVVIDTTTGAFIGYVWREVIGWIKFDYPDFRCLINSIRASSRKRRTKMKKWLLFFLMVWTVYSGSIAWTGDRDFTDVPSEWDRSKWADFEPFNVSDVNMDQKTDLVDAILILKISSGDEVTVPVSIENGDANKNGRLDLVDVICLLQLIKCLSFGMVGCGPDITITSPADGTHLKNSDFEVVVTDTGDPVTSVLCTLIIDEVPSTQSVDWPADSGAALILNTDGPLSEIAHTLRVECIDARTNVGETQTITVFIDDTPPNAPVLLNEDPGTPGQIVFDPPGYINSQVSDNSIATGLQHDVKASVDAGTEDPDNWVLTLSVTPPGGPQTPYLFNITGDPGLNQVNFANVDFGDSEGKIGFSVIVTDLAGNQSLADQAILTIDTRPPLITRETPYHDGTLTADDDAVASSDEVDVLMSFRVEGGVQSADCELQPQNCLKIMLEGSPPPAHSFPINTSIEVNQAVYSPIELLDGAYTATVTTSDAAGNEATLVYAFDVQAVEPFAEWRWPTEETTVLGPDFDNRFQASLAGFRTDSQAYLCSTIVGNLPARIPPLGDPCRWGSDGTLGGPNSGYVIGRSITTGTLKASLATFLGIDWLAQGQQVIHIEVRESDGSPDNCTEFKTFSVQK